MFDRRFIPLTIMLVAAFSAHADTPASSVYTQTVAQGQSYPIVANNSEGWFDVGGYCKVVDVGNMAASNPAARGAPVFVPGPAAQWEGFRTSAAAGSGGKITLTTCCRPADGIAQLCTEAGATVIEVSRDYGKAGETDTVTATCVDQWGRQYSDSVAVTCSGDNGPDGQAQWVEGGGGSPSGCTPDAFDTGCSAACDSTSTGTRYDSCGNPTAYTCYGGACPPPPPPPPPACTWQCNPTKYQCADGTLYDDCGGKPDSCGGSVDTWQCIPNACTPCQCFSSVAGEDSGSGCCVEAGNCAP